MTRWRDRARDRLGSSAQAGFAGPECSAEHAAEHHVADHGVAARADAEHHASDPDVCPGRGWIRHARKAFGIEVEVLIDEHIGLERRIREIDERLG